jgi:hypothetical protein
LQFLLIIFLFFFTFIHLYSPLLTFIELHWNGSGRRVFKGGNGIAGGMGMGHEGPKGRIGQGEEASLGEV